MLMRPLVWLVQKILDWLDKRKEAKATEYIPYTPLTLREHAEVSLHLAETTYDRKTQKFEFFDLIARKMERAITTGDYSRE